MLLKDLKIGLENIVVDPQKTSVQVLDVRTDVDSKSQIIGYKLTILTRKFSKNPVKIPPTPENKCSIEQLGDLLKTQDSVEVILQNPVVKAYAMLSNGNLISGVSVKCDSFTIVQEDDDDLIL